MAPKRIGVIGSGPVGICAVKTLKEEGMESVCYERTSHIGGLWRYHDDDLEGLASVMKTTIINSSKEMSAFSDFPPKEDAPNYMHNRQVFQYLTDYAQAFDVEKHVQFNKEVVSVDMADDYDDTGRIIVSVKDTKTQAIAKDTFDGVIVSIGHHVYPNMALFPGTEKFKGKIMHTHSLKKVDEFEDQNVVVVGVGNSGMDAAVEISAVSEQVYLSTRRGTWVLPRVGPWGIPLDVAVTRRWLDLLFKILPYRLVCWYSERQLNERFDHTTYSLKPKHRIWSQHPTISDSLPIKLLSGTIMVKKNIREFVENGVIFEGEDEVTECDAVILATGYKIKFPFLNEKFTTVVSNEVRLYKYIFPSHVKHPSLAIAGLIQSVGAGFPVGEAQIRWVSLVMNGKLHLPSKLEMEADIQKKIDINKERYAKSERHTIQIDYIPYMDEINALFGAKPNLLKIFFTNPVLFLTLFFGPSLPYQYRLQGPHAKPELSKVILEWDKRVIKPLKNDYKHKHINLKFPLLLFLFFITLFVSIFIQSF